jgi:hypothetical protein
LILGEEVLQSLVVVPLGEHREFSQLQPLWGQDGSTEAHHRQAFDVLQARSTVGRRPNHRRRGDCRRHLRQME